MQDEQINIYDFLQEEKSQEVAPSETLPQVDEAQDVITPEMRDLISHELEHGVDLTPSSALDAKEPTEDTDSTLFSVGDTVKVINPYHYDHEDWDYLEEWKDKVGTILKKGFKGYVVFIDDIENYFYPLELIKI